MSDNILDKIYWEEVKEGYILNFDVIKLSVLTGIDYEDLRNILEKETNISIKGEIILIDKKQNCDKVIEKIESLLVLKKLTKQQRSKSFIEWLMRKIGEDI
ncbi:MAG: hypothetical protein ACOCP8_06280 [archaeon]